MPRVVDALAKKENKKIQIVKKKSWLLTVKNIITRIRTKLSLGSKLRKFHCYLITRKNKRKKPLLKVVTHPKDVNTSWRVQMDINCFE